MAERGKMRNLTSSSERLGGVEDIAELRGHGAWAKNFENQAPAAAEASGQVLLADATRERRLRSQDRGCMVDGLIGCYAFALG